ncbi:phenylacetate--CoA ligase family protein [Algibacter miyuki]|uniref:Phenylacetate--CoA ligase family protein n=1 Tax=Algibacter miyuki TaxID=1306933 RepID=A0ABV5GYC9_9FLAO|nr:phenylacetate--CoA ligase family protein [Algibacter miyuki]MDN3667151.1 phenylacetate--CoA ligase family protein [Algibacter miyuki]
MNSILENIFEKSPLFLQESMISFFNYRAYKTRYGGAYKSFLNHYKSNNGLTRSQLQDIQLEKLKIFLDYANTNSSYYKKIFKDANINDISSLNDLRTLPIINKEDLRNNINDVYTISKEKGTLSKTGGTTGKSLEVLYTPNDLQERFALLDNFRNWFGYELGKKTAWFSGKNLLNSRDIKQNRFWKTDKLYNVRYYSTFHIHSKYLKHYLNNLIKYKPEYIVGFPSTIYEIAKFGIANNIDFPSNTIKAIFPTAETITEDIRVILESYFKTNLYNQYASSEGAPFIFECKNKKLHLELQSGVFEVLDNQDEPCTKGRLIVTAFNTHGTPLIRYDIGDEIELLPQEETCSCGNNNPLIKQILGRMSDYIYSEENGKINLGNISNCLKGVKGIVKFQIHQAEINKINVLIEKDPSIYEDKYESIFLKNLIDRVGSKMTISLNYVSEIPVEKSGKYRIVKNTLKSSDLIV